MNDVYSSVMHIKAAHGSRYISEAEYEEIRRELNADRSREELEAEEAEDNVYHNYVLNTRTPEQIIKNKLQSRDEKLKAMFAGTESAAYEVDEALNEDEVVQLCLQANLQNHDKSYVPFVNEEGKNYVVEQLRAQPANAEALAAFVMQKCQAVQLEVR